MHVSGGLRALPVHGGGAFGGCAGCVARGLWRLSRCIADCGALALVRVAVCDNVLTGSTGPHQRSHCSSLTLKLDGCNCNLHRTGPTAAPPQARCRSTSSSGAEPGCRDFKVSFIHVCPTHSHSPAFTKHPSRSFI
eukprot:6631273-Prymnesium_polylepis.1